MAAITESSFKKDIEKNTLTGAYLLYGEETYSLLQSVRKVAQKVKSAGFDDFNLQRFDSSEVSSQDVSAALESLPFFAEQKVVLLRDLNVDTLTAEETSRYEELIETIPDTSVLVIYLPNISLGKRPGAKWKRFFSNAKSLKLVEFAKKSGSDLEKYLVTFAEKRNCQLSRPLAKEMIRRCGDDLQTLQNEMTKVCGFVGQGEITRHHLQTVVTVNTEEQVFNLSKALIGGQYDKAYAIVDNLMAQNEEPVSLVALLSSSYLNLYRAKCMVQSGQPVSLLAEHFDYKGKDFLLRNAEQDCSRYTMEQLRRSLELLLEADLSLKGGTGSSRPEMKRSVLDSLIAKLLLVSQRE